MKLKDNDSRKIIISYALLATALYILYFFIMTLSGFTRTELRFGNYVLYCIAGYFALKKVVAKREGKIDYIQGMGIAFLTGALSFLFFAAFVFVYSFFNPFFTNSVLQFSPGAFVLGNFAAPFLIASEGVAMSIIFSLCLMQYFKVYTERKRNYMYFGHQRAM